MVSRSVLKRAVAIEAPTRCSIVRVSKRGTPGTTDVRTVRSGLVIAAGSSHVPTTTYLLRGRRPPPTTGVGPVGSGLVIAAGSGDVRTATYMLRWIPSHATTGA